MVVRADDSGGKAAEASELRLDGSTSAVLNSAAVTVVWFSPAVQR